MAQRQAAYEARQQARQAAQAAPPRGGAHPRGGGGHARSAQSQAAPWQAEATQLFQMLDRDGSGGVSPSELTCRLSDLGFSDHAVMSLFLNLDENSDGVISLEEFIKGYPTLKQVAEAGPGASVSSRKSMLTDDLLKKINDCVYRKWSSLRDAFRHLDGDHNQSIEPAEFVERMQMFNFNLSPDEIGALLTYFDRNHDGRISYLEFVNVMEGHAPPDEAPLQGGQANRGVPSFSTTYQDYGQGQQLGLGEVQGLMREKLYEDYTSMRDAFLALDTDRSGAIDAAEFGVVLRNHNMNLSAQDLNQLTASLDLNNDGMINYGEFVQAMQHGM